MEVIVSVEDYGGVGEGFEVFMGRCDRFGVKICGFVGVFFGCVFFVGMVLVSGCRCWFMIIGWCGWWDVCVCCGVVCFWIWFCVWSFYVGSGVWKWVGV